VTPLQNIKFGTTVQCAAHRGAVSINIEATNASFLQCDHFQQIMLNIDRTPSLPSIRFQFINHYGIIY